MLRLIAYSDYLCPWCYNASVRLHRIEAEFAGQVEIEWRTFLLRPQPDPGRTLEKFRRYTESWRRPAEEADAGTFQVWQGDAGPPSHSVPPHLVAKAAARVSRDAFRSIHDRLLHAYFAENRDITDAATLEAIWLEAGLAPEDLARAGDADVLRQVIDEHNDALAVDINGVPSVRMDGRDGFVIGAQPIAVYRRWVQRALDGKI